VQGLNKSHRGFLWGVGGKWPSPVKKIGALKKKKDIKKKKEGGGGGVKPKAQGPRLNGKWAQFRVRLGGGGIKL